MSVPTSITCSVDSNAYSRYEAGRDVVTTTVTVQGGAPYGGDPIYVELRKARRNRDTVVGSANYVLTGPSDPQTSVISFELNNLVDQDLINLVRHGKYFVYAYSPARAGSATIGNTPNNQIVVSAPHGSVYNSYTIQVVVPGGTSALTTSLSGNAITVSLSTLAGVPVTADNRATNVVNSINNLYATHGFLAAVTGNGMDSYTLAQGPVSFAGGADLVSGSSDDFDVQIITVDRFRKDWLFGLDLSASEILAPLQQPTLEGVTITKVSKGHKKGFGVLNYQSHIDVASNPTATIGSGTNGTVTITAKDNGTYAGSLGNGINVAVVVPTGTSSLSASFNSGTKTITVDLDVTGGVPNNAANTATLVAAAIGVALTDFSATASGSGVSPLTGAQTTMLTGGLTNTIRLMNWKGGPLVPVTKAGTFILQSGVSNNSPAAALIPNYQIVQEYITVRVQSPALLPESNFAENILIDNQQMDDATLSRFIDEAIAYVENDFLTIYLEPTVVTTDRDPTMIQFAAGINAPTPLYADPDYDFIVNPLTYFVPRDSAEWLKIQTPYIQLLRVDNLFGAIANTRVIDIDLQWIEIGNPSGFLQLVPFNQEIAFDFVGLIWVNAIRGAVELPNFWHFDFVAGLRDCPADIQEYIGKYAAINALTMAGLAFRPGLGSVSLSRDGVSESVSYNTAQKYGAYGPVIQSFKDWQEKVEPKLRQKYRGLNLIVV